MEEKSLLRIVTTGSVDDGKSTLMGRLLYETRSIFEDQFEALGRTSARRGQDGVDLSLVLDGLAAEREQGITIDVAYRYFETARRKFILADCPGHEQYTRNMVTGASNADCAVVLVDARHGLVTQSRRHGFILSLLQVPHVLVVVNKMDQVGFAEETYREIVRAWEQFAERLEIPDLSFLPACATLGDNVTTRSARMPWYEGSTLLSYLETLHVGADRNRIDFRLPVQLVIRPDAEYRGFAGRVASGSIRVGEAVAVLPSGRVSSVKAIETFDGPLDEAAALQSVVVRLNDEVDVSRGCMLVRPGNLPEIGTRIAATVCWMADEPLRAGTQYLLKHTTRTIKAFVSRLAYRFDVDTLHRESTDQLALNDIGRIDLQTTLPLCYDPYRLNRATGSFILVDPESNRTVAAGVIRGRATSVDDIREGKRGRGRSRSSFTVPHPVNIALETREERQRHRAAVLWLTGLSGSGKSTIGRRLERQLFARGCRTMLLDGDHLRQGLCGDLGFSPEERTENIRRAGEVARLFFEAGHLVVCTFISPIAKDRDFVRALIPPGRFYEVHVDCSVEECIKRDPNGLYRNALKGEIGNFTGISAGYEPPTAPELVLRTDLEVADALVERLIARLVNDGVVPPA